MSALFGWPNGTVGMIIGTLAGLLICYQVWRDAPWDVHDEQAYQEPDHFSLAVAAPSLILLGVLATLVLGLGVLDRDIRPELGMSGDIVGLVLVPLSAYHFLRWARRPSPPS